MRKPVLVIAAAAFAVGFTAQAFAHEGHHHCKKGFVMTETGACVKPPK